MPLIIQMGPGYSQEIGLLNRLIYLQFDATICEPIHLQKWPLESSRFVLVQEDVRQGQKVVFKAEAVLDVGPGNVKQGL